MIYTIFFSSDEARIVTSWEGTCIQLWDAAIAGVGSPRIEFAQNSHHHPSEGISISVNAWKFRLIRFSSSFKHALCTTSHSLNLHHLMTVAQPQFCQCFSLVLFRSKPLTTFLRFVELSPCSLPSRISFGGIDVR
jgi:hypothetical protein